MVDRPLAPGGGKGKGLVRGKAAKVAGGGRVFLAVKAGVGPEVGEGKAAKAATLFLRKDRRFLSINAKVGHFYSSISAQNGPI